MSTEGLYPLAVRLFLYIFFYFAQFQLHSSTIESGGGGIHQDNTVTLRSLKLKLELDTRVTQFDTFN